MADILKLKILVVECGFYIDGGNRKIGMPRKTSYEKKAENNLILMKCVILFMLF